MRDCTVGDYAAAYAAVIDTLTVAGAGSPQILDRCSMLRMELAALGPAELATAVQSAAWIRAPERVKRFATLPLTLDARAALLMDDLVWFVNATSPRARYRKTASGCVGAMLTGATK